MSETGEPRRLGRTVVAVVAGSLAAALLSIGTDVLMHAGARTRVA